MANTGCGLQRIDLWKSYNLQDLGLIKEGGGGVDYRPVDEYIMPL